LKTAKQGTTTKETYTYDLVGNRLSSLGVNPYNYNSSNELTSIPSGSYTYDNNGNRKSDPAGAQYSWDFENRLTQVILPGTSGTVNFKYDPFGRRVQKAFTQNGTTTTTNYLYDGANILETTDQSGNVLTRYVEALNVDEPLSELVSGTTSYYQQDGLGSVSSLSNSAGALANTYTYDSYGKLTASTGTVTNPFQYTGREFDPEAGIYGYRARYYDQNVGRFISEDPIRFWGGIDFYSYVGNGPTNFADPLGLQQASKPPAPKPDNSWWDDLKNLAKECWKDVFACGGKPGSFGVGPAPFNLCNAGDISLFHRSAPNNPHTQGTGSNSVWVAQFNQDCAALSTPDKPTYPFCSGSSVSYGGTSSFCHCCQSDKCKAEGTK
jgi:RHS repeat-associated protein